MRARYATAVVALVLIGSAGKFFFFAAPPAEAEMRPSLDISRIEIGKPLPVQKLDDMSFVFSQPD
jgi:hypothetical protein